MNSVSSTLSSLSLLIACLSVEEHTLACSWPCSGLYTVPMNCQVSTPNLGVKCQEAHRGWASLPHSLSCFISNRADIRCWINDPSWQRGKHLSSWKWCEEASHPNNGFPHWGAWSPNALSTYRGCITMVVLSHATSYFILTIALGERLKGRLHWTEDKLRSVHPAGESQSMIHSRCVYIALELRALNTAPP